MSGDEFNVADGMSGHDLMAQGNDGPATLAGALGDAFGRVVQDQTPGQPEANASFTVSPNTPKAGM